MARWTSDDQKETTTTENITTNITNENHQSKRKSLLESKLITETVRALGLLLTAYV